MTTHPLVDPNGSKTTQPLVPSGTVTVRSPWSFVPGSPLSVKLQVTVAPGTPLSLPVPEPWIRLNVAPELPIEFASLSQVEDVMLVMWKLLPLPQLISRLSGWMNEKQWIMNPWCADFPT